MENGVIDKVLNQVEHAVDEVENEVEQIVQPVIKSILERFPSVFLLLVTFGVVCVLFGFERVLMEIPWLADRPILMVAVGVSILVLTGRLFKKLD